MNKPTTIKFRVSKDLKAKFDAHCQQQDTTSSEQLRQFMQSQVGAETTPATVTKAAFKTRFKTVATKLTESEYQSMALAAARDNATNSKWLLKCIRERSLQLPQLSATELEALSLALYQLKSVGRNLNQYVRHLNSGTHINRAHNELDADALTASITDTTQAIKTLIKGTTVRDFEHG